MKKLIVFFAVVIIASTTKVSAQQFIARLTTTGITEGANTVPVPEFKGTLKFVKRGDTYSNMVFLDSAGTTISLAPVAGGSNGAPRPACKSKLPDACFATADKNIGLCICKPDGLSSGETTIIVQRKDVGVLKAGIKTARID